MKRFSAQQILQLFAYWTVLVLLAACMGSQSGNEATVLEYNGVGLHHESPQNTIVSGTVKSKNFSGGEIMVEARRSVPCQYGRCPVVGEEPLAKKSLVAPGPYSLELGVSAKDLMIIATEQQAGGGARIAHYWVLTDSADVSGIDLSLDRPHSPLR